MKFSVSIMPKSIELSSNHFLSIIKRKIHSNAKFIICFFVFVLLIILISLNSPQNSRSSSYPGPYPFEVGQHNVNGLLTDQEFRKIFEPSLNQNKVECKNESITLVAINSGIKNFDKRQAIRNTWSKWVHKSNQTLLFFVAQSKDLNIQKQIELENNNYGDLILLPIEESYYLLSFKILSILNWSVKNCPNIKFLIKCDDDMYVHWNSLNELLIAKQNQTNVIFGKYNQFLRTNRDKKSRWYMPYSEYSRDRYPQFAVGGIYIISNDLVPKLLEKTKEIKMIYLEDVLITGLLRDRVADAKLIEIKNLFAHYQSNEFTNCLPHSVYSFHKVTTDQMKFLFENYNFQRNLFDKKISSFFCPFLSN